MTPGMRTRILAKVMSVIPDFTNNELHALYDTLVKAYKHIGKVEVLSRTALSGLVPRNLSLIDESLYHIITEIEREMKVRDIV